MVRALLIALLSAVFVLSTWPVEAQSPQRRAPAKKTRPAVSKPAADRGAVDTKTRNASVTLTLADAIAITLRDNRTIQSAYVSRISQKFKLRVIEDRFTPQLSVSGGVMRQSIAGVATTTAEATPAVDVLLPTGATFGFAWVNRLTETAGLQTRTSVAELSLTQPLLRGGGIEVNTAPIKSARLGEEVNKLRLKATISETIGQVIMAYRSLLRSQEEVRLANESVARAESLITVNRELISAGRMAGVEIVQSEADLESQRIRVLEARRSEDAARLDLLNLLALDLDTKIVALESTLPARIQPSLARLLPVALAQRPDYRGQRHVVEQVKLGIVVAKNERLWDLSLFASARQGRERTAGLYPNSTTISDVTVGMAFNIPLNDLRREQPLLDATTNLQTAELQLAAIRQGVELQIRRSVMEIDIRWRQLETARRAKELSSRAVEIEREKLRAGRSSNFQVRILENELRATESQLVSGLVDYLNALSVLDLQLGTTLDTWRIDLRE